MYIHFNNNPFIEQISGEGELLQKALRQQKILKVVLVFAGITVIYSITKMLQYQEQVKQLKEKGNLN